MAKEKETVEVEVTEVKAAKKPVDVEAFIARKLRAINKMENKAHARVLGERVLQNR